MGSSEAERGACCILLSYHPLIAEYLWRVEWYVRATCFSTYTHTQNQNTHLRDSVTLEGVICAAVARWEAFTGRYVAGTLFLEEHWYLLIKFYPTLL